MKKVFIDLTSKNNSFISFDNQGSFIDHRFGKRAIPEEHLDFNKITNFLLAENPNQIILESVFGDPLEYYKIEEFINFCDGNNIQIICVTNGVSDKIHLLKKCNSYCIFKLYGFEKTISIVTPDIKFESIQKNLKYCNKIHYYVYKENLSDISAVQENEYNIEVEYFPGPTVGHDINHVMSIDGKWYHDVHSLDIDESNYNYNSLKDLDVKDTGIVKTVVGYHLLKTFLRPIQGKSLLETSLPKQNLSEHKFNELSVCYKGFIHNSVPDRNFVTNTYIPDWEYKRILQNPDFLQTSASFKQNIKSI